ncbi:histone-like nucleoid-structuring protein MvaT [Pseudomonas sp. LS-2]|uniref:histone-like nucleoid-structuring protein MvaT n=1 Tax=Pseudomonas sp. LS-2 TaxID=2315859 RepID=UPI000E7699C4|nr:histone-like nucleoid-structuring protein MvaT [Pseudomonas sp. LS-2]RJX72590.1 H-NS histone [Pseudomonas sp. LS-2]
MSLINEYRSTEESIKELQRRLEELSKDDRLAKELEFEGKLRSLMGEYQKSLRDIIALLDPQAGRNSSSKANPQVKAQRRERVMKVYKNPHNGEIVETKGGNHKTLKNWKQEYGGDTVESWVQA